MVPYDVLVTPSYLTDRLYSSSLECLLAFTTMQECRVITSMMIKFLMQTFVDITAHLHLQSIVLK